MPFIDRYNELFSNLLLINFSPKASGFIGLHCWFQALNIYWIIFLRFFGKLYIADEIQSYPSFPEI